MKLSNAGKYAKAITAVAGQALTYAALYYGTNHWVALAVALASALGVYAVPNVKPSAPVKPSDTPPAPPAPAV
jgi:hypothetical protein